MVQNFEQVEKRVKSATHTNVLKLIRYAVFYLYTL